ncbi:MAG: dephospho-CoA kinase [Mariprofundaceae bacterium]
MKVQRTATVGLIGGIGSGKSTVAGMFAELEVPVLDLDEVGRKLTGPGQEGLKAISVAFGSAVLFADGTLDRQKLASLTFSDENKLKVLTEIIHPLIWKQEKIWLSGLDVPYAIIEAAALLESKGAGRVDAIIAIISKCNLRRHRVKTRGHPAISHFDNIIRRQCQDEDRLQEADFIMYNDGGLDVLRSQVVQTHEKLLNRFSSSS